MAARVKTPALPADPAALLTQMEAFGKENYRAIYRKHGARDPLFGVGQADLNIMQKGIKVDHAAAVALWQTGNWDARRFATMIADPKQADRATLEQWGADLYDYGLSDYLATYILRTSFAREITLDWTARDGEWVEYCGWVILGGLAERPDVLTEDELAATLERIEANIGGAKNRVRHGMNQALITIALRSDRLRALAEAAAARIGVVVVDHGETSCETPDAASYIAKTMAYREKKGKKAG